MESAFNSNTQTVNRNIVVLVVVGTLISFILVVVTAGVGGWLIYKNSGDLSQRLSEALSRSSISEDVNYYQYSEDSVFNDVEYDVVNPDLEDDESLTSNYEISLNETICVATGADAQNTYYRLIAKGEASGPVGSKVNVNSMQTGLAGAKSKEITLDCGGWQFEQNQYGYQCLRRDGDASLMKFTYTEENLFYQWCPFGSSCSDVNENLYFMNVYIYDPAIVTGQFQFRPDPLSGASLDFTPFKCGAFKGSGLKFTE